MNGYSDCSFCDAVFRSGCWISTDGGVPVWSCPECGAGWNPMEALPAAR
jgi:hypothetical protein